MQAREVATCGHAVGNQGPDGCRGLLTRAQASSHTEMPSTIGVSRGSYPSSQSAAAPPPEGEEDSLGIARGIGDYTPGLDASAADSQIQSWCILPLQLHSRKSPTFSTARMSFLENKHTSDLISQVQRAGPRPHAARKCVLWGPHIPFLKM